MRLVILFLTFFSLILSYGQELTTDQNLVLNETTIKKLFQHYPVWSYCSDSESAYDSADTLLLFSDIYYYLTTKCCYETTWNITKSETLDMTLTKVCQEPPPSIIDFEKRALELRFEQSYQSLKLTISKNNKLKDQLYVVSLDYIELRKDQFAYRLTLVR